ncbi:MAG: TetR/AcrR family transcriptional regulator [Actinomycetota bacterium]|nr:TetR/AcrR family transcriptional regulator [Actinomycetota bacterium]
MSLASRPTSRAGRRRDPACDAAIRDATLDVFVEEGYLGVSIEGVAARAGVGKASIYRRYANKAELIVEAIVAKARISDHLPDTGDLRADLRSMLQHLAERLRSDDGRVLVTFMGERLRHPDLAAEYERSVIGAKRAHTRALFRAAIERGDLPADTDVEVIAEAGPAMLWHFALNGLPLTDDLVDRILAAVLPEP